MNPIELVVTVALVAVMCICFMILGYMVGYDDGKREEH